MLSTEPIWSVLVSEWLLLASRGFVLVGLVSWQTRNLQRGGGFRIAFGAFVLGCAWYGNVLATVEQVPWGWLPYAIGSAAGAVTGCYVSRLRL
jgi:hypothetical protein